MSLTMKQRSLLVYFRRSPRHHNPSELLQIPPCNVSLVADDVVLVPESPTNFV